MGKTISTHNGSVANRDHNIRNPKATDKQGHISRELRSQNEILHDEKPRDAYMRIFGDALAKYNAKQKRPERQIKDYYNHVSKDAKKHPVYEMIVQIGDRNDTGLDAPLERECLKEFYYGWKERNPNLECIGAYLHADEHEGTVHLHIDYVPIATGYKRGLEVQNGLVKALEQQGFKMDKDHPKTAQIQWEARENAILELICERHGIEVVHPERDKRKHLDTDMYKAQAELDSVREEYEMVSDAVDKMLEVKCFYEDEALKAQHSFSATEREISLLEGHKEILEDSINSLENKHRSLQSLIDQKAKIEQELPSLQERISDAKSELRVVESAIKDKIGIGESLYTTAGLQERIRLAREQQKKQDRTKHLEQIVARFERFLDAVPIAKGLYRKWLNDERQNRIEQPIKSSHDRDLSR